MIDRLERSASGKKVAVTYTYFGYKEQKNQKVGRIAASLLKQLLCRLDEIPKEIFNIYRDWIISCSRPPTELLVEMFIKVSQWFSETYVIFDALDEYGDEIERKKFLGFVQVLQKHGFKIFLTSRDHLREELENSLNDIFVCPIVPEENVVRSFLAKRLAEKEMPDSVRDATISRLLETAKSGM